MDPEPLSLILLGLLGPPDPVIPLSLADLPDPLVQVDLEYLEIPLSLADLENLLHQQPQAVPILRLATYCLVQAHLHKFAYRRIRSRLWVYRRWGCSFLTLDYTDSQSHSTKKWHRLRSLL